MSIESLSDLFVHMMKDMYFAEKHIQKSLPKMIENTSDAKLKTAFEDHLDETETQIERLEKAFESIGQKAEGEKCPAIMGIVKEAEELIDEVKNADALDAALIAAAQAVEHYEITRYGTLCVWAKTLGHTEAKNLLEENLSEEKDADSNLSRMAEDSLNAQAAA